MEADEGSSSCSFTAKSDAPNLEFVCIHVKSVSGDEGRHCTERKISANRKKLLQKEKVVAFGIIKNTVYKRQISV
jgi:hypothetical protein